MLWILFIYFTRIAKLSSIYATSTSPQIIDRLLDTAAKPFSVTTISRSKFIQLCTLLFLIMCLGPVDARALKDNKLQFFESESTDLNLPPEHASLKNMELMQRSSEVKMSKPTLDELKELKCKICHIMRIYYDFSKIDRQVSTTLPPRAKNQKTTFPIRLSNANFLKKLQIKQSHTADMGHDINLLRDDNRVNNTKSDIDEIDKSISTSFHIERNEVSQLVLRSRIRRSSGDRRIKRLFCRTGYILQIHENGKVDGTYDSRSELGIMEIQTVDRDGVVSIRSVATGRYLAMSRSGVLYGAVNYDSEHSAFTERIVEGWYNTYSVSKHPKSKRKRPLYVALSKRGKAKKGKKITQSDKSAHFLPLRVNI